ncbi:EF-hand domain-containing protein [Fodinicola acaciae]|uniref:EF-hand domain-containing protein n=1 Tax=Fodinicola acaciae TaxID=2681555 RepID=UPI0013D7D380|nr:EF-hand domain-containing protein [Fodinicola acaciae]
MASDFQRRKVGGVFDAMDDEHRGYLTRNSFEALAARWTSLRGLVPDSAEYAHLRSIMLGWWDSLSASAQNGERVTLDDVMAVVDQLPTMTGAVNATADAMFEAIDENGDRRISRSEYRQLVEAWTGQETDTDEIFERLDLDGDGHISHEEFRRLWTQFWVEDDPTAPGTWVFGHLAEPAH